jgi:hypothetical protein
VRHDVGDIVALFFDCAVFDLDSVGFVCVGGGGGVAHFSIKGFFLAALSLLCRLSFFRCTRCIPAVLCVCWGVVVWCMFASGSERSSSLVGRVVSVCWSVSDSSLEEFRMSGLCGFGVGVLFHSMSMLVGSASVSFLLLCVSGRFTNWEFWVGTVGVVLPALGSACVVGFDFCGGVASVLGSGGVVAGLVWVLGVGGVLVGVV